MGSCTPEPQKLWIETPCIPSAALSQAAGCNIYLKLENLQPSGSFKSRGIGNLMQRALLAHRTTTTAATTTSAKGGGTPPPSAIAKEEEPVPVVHFYCSSGGNAGLACATAAAALQGSGAPCTCTCTIAVPLATPARVVAKLEALGATVHRAGGDWAAADEFLRAEMARGGSGSEGGAGVYVPPFDHPHVWEGAASMVDEIVAQMAGFLRPANGDSNGKKSSGRIDGIVCSVGGGGLLNGIMEGVERSFPNPEDKSNSSRPRVLAVETAGADSLNRSVLAGELVTLPAITSVASSLGATRVSARTFEWATNGNDLTSLVVSDADAVAAAVRFADDARMLVEVACGAAVAPAYNGDLRRVLGAGLGDAEWAGRNVVLVVCGGSNVTLEMLRAYRERFLPGVG